MPQPGGGSLFGSSRGNRPTPGSGTATSARSTQRLIFLQQMENKLPFKHMKREGNDGARGGQDRRRLAEHTLSKKQACHAHRHRINWVES